MFKHSATHGFLAKSIDTSILAKVNKHVKLFLNKNPNRTYFSTIDEQIPLVRQLISSELEQKIQIILQCNSVKLFNIELHYLKPAPNSIQIPYHQDNFYHCVEGGVGLKVLVPLASLSFESGALSFLDCKSSIGVLEHSPSTIENFSSYINLEIINTLHMMDTTYVYDPGDASYHLLNSIHFSHGNKTFEERAFVVFRYQSLAAKECPNLRSNYIKCYKKHVNLMTNRGKS